MAHTLQTLGVTVSAAVLLEARRFTSHGFATDSLTAQIVTVVPLQLLFLVRSSLGRQFSSHFGNFAIEQHFLASKGLLH